MAQMVTPAFVDALTARCAEALSSGDSVEGHVVESILDGLRAVSEHLVMLEQHGLGEWIRDLPPESLTEFLADMELTARQASSDSDIGSFISTLADWQTSAEAARNDW
ncbi:MAG: hypothetical protein AAGD33_19665 [Actinomycetota bacterium]